LTQFFDDLPIALDDAGAVRLAHWGQLTLYSLPSSTVRPLIYGTGENRHSAVPRIDFQVNSPVEFTVSGKGGSGEFNLVMNQTWNSGWEILGNSSSSPDYLSPKDCFMSVVYRLSGINLPFCSREESGVGTSASQALPIGNYWQLNAKSFSTSSHLLVYEPQLVQGWSLLISLIACGSLGLLYALLTIISYRRRSRST
jgi:hypothetical protein